MGSVCAQVPHASAGCVKGGCVVMATDCGAVSPSPPAPGESPAMKLLLVRLAAACSSIEGPEALK